MSYMEAAMERQYEAWMEQEREWYEISNQLIGEGWHHCSLNKALSQEELTEMNQWLNEKYYGRHERFNDEVVLPTEQDIMWFKLRFA
jgi:hypothetical protein